MIIEIFLKWSLLYRSFSLIWATNRSLSFRFHDKSIALNVDDVVSLKHRLALFERLFRNFFFSCRCSFVSNSVRRSMSRTKYQSQQQEERLLHDDEISRYRIRYRFNEDSSIYWEARKDSKSCDDLFRKTSYFALRFEVFDEIFVLRRKSSDFWKSISSTSLRCFTKRCASTSHHYSNETRSTMMTSLFVDMKWHQDAQITSSNASYLNERLRIVRYEKLHSSSFHRRSHRDVQSSLCDTLQTLAHQRQEDDRCSLYYTQMIEYS